MTNLLTYILCTLKLSKVVRHMSLVGFLGLPCLVINCFIKLICYICNNEAKSINLNLNLNLNNSQLATRNSQLAARNSQLATRNSQLATRNSQLATPQLANYPVPITIRTKRHITIQWQSITKTNYESSTDLSRVLSSEQPGFHFSNSRRAFGPKKLFFSISRFY